MHRGEHRARQRARRGRAEEAIVWDLEGGGYELPPLITRLMITALEAGELAAY
jgi:hypothetical protein